MKRKKKIKLIIANNYFSKFNFSFFSYFSLLRDGDGFMKEERKKYDCATADAGTKVLAQSFSFFFLYESIPHATMKEILRTKEKNK
jgi:hypothetical protein